MPISVLRLDDRLWDGAPQLRRDDWRTSIVDLLDDAKLGLEGEHTLLKKRASAFHGTPLAGILRAAGVDTILVTGVTATACVRTTICDGLGEGFRTIAVREAIGDRVPGAVAWNLYDIDAKFADVHGVDECVSYLNSVNGNRIAAE